MEERESGSSIPNQGTALLGFSAESSLGPHLGVVDELDDDVLDRLLDGPDPVDGTLRGVHHGAGTNLVALAVRESQPLSPQDV